MPSGGKRPGAGRPTGAGVVRKENRPNPDLDADTPLEFLLEVMHDRNLPVAFRTKAAALAAPYVHPKTSEDKREGKKEKAQRAAHEAGNNSPWGGDLAVAISNKAQ